MVVPSYYDLNFDFIDLRFFIIVSNLGHFKSVTASHDIVWAVASNGTAWYLSADYHWMCDPKLGDTFNHLQTDFAEETVLESQRYSVLSGYRTFTGMANGKYYAWADETGTRQKSKGHGTVRVSSHGSRCVSVILTNQRGPGNARVGQLCYLTN